MCGTNELFEQFQRRDAQLISEHAWRDFSVLIPLVFFQNEWCILFETRSKNLSAHAGETSFPGGAMEDGESYEQCAVRETMEELCVERSQIEVLGPSDIFVAPSNRKIHSYIGILNNYEMSFSTDEVQGVFCVPIKFLMEAKPEEYYNKLKMIVDENFPTDRVYHKRPYAWQAGGYRILFYNYEKYIIWGMTARLLEVALKHIKDFKLIEYLENTYNQRDKS